MRDRLRLWIERLLPWYDRDAEQAHNRRSEEIRRRSIATRISAEHVKDAYRTYGTRVRR